MLGRVIAGIWRSLLSRPSDAAAPEEIADLARAARTAIAAGKRELGIEYAERALDQDAECHEARLLLANLYLQGRSYEQIIADIHQHVRPRSYVEIGVATGKSLRLVRAETVALGVDPDPAIQFELSPNTRVFRETSDDFFSRRDVRGELGGLDVDLAFIDGLHHFDFALRDFINLERLCGRGATILAHDCLPLDRASSQRERKSGFWSGDVWRLIVLLKKYRPDLRIHVVAAPPTGLAIIRNLDPASRVIADRFEELRNEFLALDYGYLAAGRAEKLNLVANDWAGIRALLDAPAG